MEKILEVPRIKTIQMQVEDGKIVLLSDGNSIFVEYHNKIYKGSPFKLATSFSTSFTYDQIMQSSEVVSFLSRFN